MYPVIRMVKELVINRNKPPLGILDEHVSTHLCWPWDLDVWNELNNGRTLTIYDLGRIPMGQRTGLTKTLMREKWGMAIAGASVRYRRRVKMFDRITMRSKMVGWDARFVYIQQSMWKSNGDCASHALFRSAITDRNGIVGTDRLCAAMGFENASPVLPEWVQQWIQAEDLRPWPPMQDN